MGYSLDLFTSPNLIHTEFICFVCQDVMKAPIMLENCEHIYCSSCISQEEWKATSSSNTTCPVDQSPILGLRPPIQPYMNIYNQLQLKCGNEGCSIVTCIGQIDSHHKQCQHQPEATRPCVRNCGATEVKMKDWPVHDCIEYLKGEVRKKDRRIEILKLNQVEALKLGKTKDEGHKAQIEELRRQMRKKDQEIYQLKLRTMVKAGGAVNIMKISQLSTPTPASALAPESNHDNGEESHTLYDPDEIQVPSDGI